MRGGMCIDFPIIATWEPPLTQAVPLLLAKPDQNRGGVNE
jgi:hypothetical protein